MLWSLIKIVLFIGLIAALTWGAGILLETGGGVRVAIGTIEFNLGPLQALIGIGLLLVALWLVLKLLSLTVAILRFLSGDETAITRWRGRARERKGFEALADGLMALASGEGRAAMAKAARAERYLKRPELTNLITAQAAEMSGDRAKAEEVYKRLLQDERTRFVGVRGIMKQKLAAGDTDTAMKLAEKAFALKPRHEETQDILLRLQADHGDWSGARQTLGAKLKYGTLPRNVHRRRDAVLALGEAKSIVEEGKSIEARETAIQANKLSPDLVPAAVMAAESYIEKGQKKYAARVLTKAWNARPHPDLAAAFGTIEPDETPEARLKRFTALTRQHAGDPETKMLLAELNIAAENFGDARRAMGTLAEEAPTARSLTIMAAIERGEGAGDSIVKGYLARAVNASRGPQWVCGNCQHIPGHWTPVCGNCGAFDSLDWREAPQGSETAMQGGAMLPLIVGTPEPAKEEPPAEPVELAAPAEEAPGPDAPETPDTTAEPSNQNEAVVIDADAEPAPPEGEIEEHRKTG
ncbi:heme biosynthesis protein HemY [Ovoidimarina sediminis]|uniref:heme biosynthesis protein HemY n=1 Tax=Ovoidimarina sediminis TaxID=3079856 RepID=UPI00290E5183|nr:heme biosynthesis HemY N-terminal domain-containing protein [Rhodophyticola sp. MJ-SS7]MDU8942501.1 heme biosynthesis HemY N-terminal domain-containing protein [Rhodophyticola sp. MJ-SS7]